MPRKTNTKQPSSGGKRPLFLPFSTDSEVPSLEAQAENFISSLKELIPGADFTYILPQLSWQHALQQGEGYGATICCRTANMSEPAPLGSLPLMTPRKTLVIDGVERTFLTVLLPNAKIDSTLSEFECTRDLAGFTAKQLDIYGYLANYCRHKVELQHRYKANLEGKLQKLQEQPCDEHDDDERKKIKEKLNELDESFMNGGVNGFKKALNGKLCLQYIPALDICNPLSELEHLRKVVFLRGARTRKGRDIHPSQYGRLCVVHTPESEKIGLRLHLARYTKVIEGQICTPVKLDVSGRLEEKYIPPLQDRKQRIADLWQASDNGSLVIRGAEEISDDQTCYTNSVKVDSSEVTASDCYPDQLLSFAALQIPFVHHNDPARAMMGAKNLKQATPLVSPETPVIRTGHEDEVARQSGRAVYARAAGRVSAVTPEAIMVGDQEYPLITCCFSRASRTAFGHTPLVRPGEEVAVGQILADSSALQGGSLALGVNALVAYMPYYGLNIDDALVVSESLAKRLTSIHVESVTFPLRKGDIFRGWLTKVGDRAQSGKKLAQVERGGASVIVSVPGTIPEATVVRHLVSIDEVSIDLRLERPLRVGDKLMGRHGNKGVVSRILPDDEMPVFTANGNKHVVQIIMNPHGVIARMNLGQLCETHFGWVANEHPDADVRKRAMEAGAPFVSNDLDTLSGWLEEAGLDRSGKARVRLHDGTETTQPVVVGYQYIVKLNHLAEKKLSIRWNDKKAVSPITGQPTAGRFAQRGQRIGEMEMWALLAHGADNVAREFLSVKSGAPEFDDQPALSLSIAALVFYLRGLKIDLVFYDKDKNEIEPEDFDKTPYSSIQSYEVSLADEYRVTEGWGYHYDVSEGKAGRNKEAVRKKEPRKVIATKELYPSHGLPEMGYIKIHTEAQSYTVPVIPRVYRLREDDQLNLCYEKLLKAKSKYEKALNENNATDQEKYLQVIESQVTRINDTLLSRIKGKKGLIRKALLGRRINQSCRAVIVPDPDQAVDSIKVPASALTALELKDGDKALLNRQPTLHIHNMQAVTACPHDHDVISIHPLLCNGFNADFDGDTMALYHTGEKLPLWMDASRNIFSASNGQIGLSLSQDIVAGLAIASRDEKGRKELSEKFGAYYSVAEPLDKDKAAKIVADYFEETKDFEASLGLADELSKIGLKWATTGGVSFGLYDLNAIANDLDLPRAATDGEIEAALKRLLRKQPESCISTMINSGARGDVKQLRQMVVRRGSVQRIIGENTTHPVDGCYLQGLSPTNYYIASFGARNSLGDKKLTTPQCGYLTRKLAFAGANLCISLDDCNTEFGIEIPIEQALGRILLDDYDGCKSGDVVTFLLMGKNRGNSVVVRSPLTCKSEKGICAKCYGWHLSRRELPETGLHVGLLAAEVIGERATQDAMRTYHSGSQTGTITSFSRTKELFATPLEGLDKILAAVEELHTELYQGKLNRKHYEVILRALCTDIDLEKPDMIKMLGLGSKDLLTTWTLLSNAAFESPDKILRDGGEGVFNADTFSRMFR